MSAPTDRQHQRMTAAVRAELWRAAWAAVFEGAAEKCQSPGATPATATDETAPADRKEPISDAS
jgi:hypothetical protein